MRRLWDLLRRIKFRSLIPAVCLLASLVVLVAFAVVANGFPIRKLDLNDSGIWVTNDKDNAYGRLNKAAAGLDAYLNPPSARGSSAALDVFQDGATILVRDVAGGRLIPVEAVTAANQTDQVASIGPEELIDLRGGTVAVVNPATGKVHAARYEVGHAPLLSALDDSLPAVAELGPAKGADSGPPAAIAVGPDGVLHAASITGKVVSVAPDGTGFAKPVYGQLAGGLRSIQATAVGRSMVFFDAVTGVVSLPDGKTTQLQPDPSAKLQQPGPDADRVLIASKRALLDVPLNGGAALTLFADVDGDPAQPVRLAGCAFGAWAGDPGTVVRGCNGSPAVELGIDRSDSALKRPVFRTNRGGIVVNDAADGRILDIDLLRRVDDWDAIKPPQKQDSTTKKNQRPQQPKDSKPKANPDDLGARPDRTTVLHVLDNDTDVGGKLLSITDVTQPSGGARVDIAPDGQTVLFSLPKEGRDAAFKYTISNGSQSAVGDVRVHVRAPNENGQPFKRKGATARVLSVAAGGTINLAVMPDWRDPDGDPVTLVDATSEKASVPATGDGRIEYTAAGDARGTKTVDYRVSDGFDDADVAAAVGVNVVSAATSIAPIAQPDAARGEVRRPILIRPLANDLPGSDGNPLSRLALAAKVAGRPNITVDTDLKAGIVTVTGTKPGTYFLDYRASFGSAAISAGVIRVDIAAGSAQSKPVAVPDEATLRGQSAVIVDVLANDYDPGGALLTVQGATPAEATQVQAAVLDGRWLRISALRPKFAVTPQIVRYSLTNGTSAPVTGEVTVTQVPALAEDPPITRDDFASVRDNDSVSIPVLSNDSTLGGSALSLQTNVQGAGAAGLLKVSADDDTDDVGMAYVVGDSVRYVAPGKVAEPLKVTITYYALNEQRNQVAGQAYVTVLPQPDAGSPDQAPEPQAIEARAVAGDTINIGVPSSGQDPDGDSVSLVGVSSAPKLGRLLGFTPTGLTYQAYPVASAGTDTFEFAVTDRYGKQGTAVVRVAVVPPGQSQLPAAVADSLVVKPGANVRVNPMSNDLFAADDRVQVAPLAETNKTLPAGAALDAKTGTITLTAPAGDGESVVVSYALEGNAGRGAPTQITVTTKAGFQNPPHIFDAVAKPDGAFATVDALKGAWDPDGDIAAAKITKVGDPAATVTGDQIKVPVLDRVQAIPFEVTDDSGARSAAVIYVPAAKVGVPYLKAGSLIRVERNASVEVNLADYVLSTRGKKIVLLSGDQVWASPAAVAAKAKDATTLTVKAGEYSGPGAVTIAVTDGNGPTDETGLQAVLSIPVQVGADTPFLRCPSDVQEVVAGSLTRSIDVTTFCHVWTPNPSDSANLRYSATWKKPIDGVRAEGDRQVALTAAGSAVPGATGTLTIGVQGSDAVAQDISVRVKAAPLPALAPISLTGIRQGQSKTVDVADYLTSPLVDKLPSVISVQRTGGMEASASASGSVVTITPGATSSGTITFSLVATDTDPARVERHVTGVISAQVYGVPGAPSAPQPGAKAQSHTETLRWSAGASNGAPIDSYEVQWAGGTAQCQASPCRISGLTNGRPVVFRVRAHNLAGWGPLSAPSRTVIPNSVPKAVTGIRAADPQDGRLSLSWNAAAVDGTPVLRYQVRVGGNTRYATGTSLTLTGLNNNTRYPVTIIAENAAGPGPAATGGPFQSSGKPRGVQAPTVKPTTPLGASTPVRVTWAAADPNGPGPVTYAVSRSGKTICSGVRSTSCTDDGVAYDGKTYSYAVTATNATPGHSTTGASTSWSAVGTPAAWGNVSVRASGINQITVTASVPDSRGATSRVAVLVDGATRSTAGSGPWVISGVASGQRDVVLTLTNESGRSSSSAGASVTAYGPLSPPNLDVNVNGTTVGWTASASGNYRPASLSVTTSRGGGSGPVGLDPGAGSGTTSGSLDAGYSATVTVTATVRDDPTRPAQSVSKTVTTPPPPQPTVSIGFGTVVPGSCGATCHYVVVTTRNFAGNVNCQVVDFARTRSVPAGTTTGSEYEYWTQGGNETKQTRNYWGAHAASEWIKAVCNGVESAPHYGSS